MKGAEQADKDDRYCLKVLCCVEDNQSCPSLNPVSYHFISKSQTSFDTVLSASSVRVSHDCCYHGYSLFHIHGVQCTSSVTGGQCFCCFSDEQQD